MIAYPFIQMFWAQSLLRSFCGGYGSRLHLPGCLAVILVLFCALLQAARASQSVTLEWDGENEPDLAGYRVRYGTQSGIYDHDLFVGRATTATISDIKRRRTYYVLVVAYDYRGVESLPSNEVVYSAAAGDQSDALFAAYRGGYTGSLVEGSGGRNASVIVDCPSLERSPARCISRTRSPGSKVGSASI
jgi:hypothetical protein